MIDTTYIYVPKCKSTASRFHGTIEECQNHVKVLSRAVKGYRYRIRARGPRAIHVGKTREKSWNGRYFVYSSDDLRRSLPLSLATHGVVYDNLDSICSVD
jgi:hypothetical protein